MKQRHENADQKLQRQARIMRRAHETGSPELQEKAIDAQNELHKPEHAKGRPPPGGRASNAGNDGGA